MGDNPEVVNKSGEDLSAVVRDTGNFALMLEAACEDFEILDRLVRDQLKIVSNSTEGPEGHQLARVEHPLFPDA
jgi:hypothetical protein